MEREPRTPINMFLKFRVRGVEPRAKMYSYLLQQRGMQQEVMSRHKVTKSVKNWNTHTKKGKDRTLNTIKTTWLIYSSQFLIHLVLED